METHLVSSALVRSGLMLFVAATAACDGTKPVDAGVNCPDLLRPLVVAEIRDGSGKAAAIGSTLSVFHNDQLLATSTAPYDSLKAFVYGRSTGPVDVVVSKPSFATVLISGVKIPVTACGTESATVSVKLIATAN